ncbi:MAG TPA: glycoside hydrolase family 9 protein [Polyangiaceae bacterium]|nr:glycoside hydrolase family 9 protein [Polyangiaceae bacterium]
MPQRTGAAGPFTSCERTPLNELLRVDQFGYLPSAQKVAVLSDPVEGWNAHAGLTPGSTYEVRSWTDGALVFSGAPKQWNRGAVERSSGDRGYWFDFSSVAREGSYCIVDKVGGFRSPRFGIGAHVYRPVLRAASKVFYFQRANFPKEKPYACVGDKCWLASADYVGPGQDRDARSVKERANAKTARDLSGGWWDAGDTNKYVTFVHPVVHQLLTAYSERSAAFGDDFGIPESGNGIPDILDELKYELDWMRRMQPTDLGGGVLPKVGNVDHGDPIPEKSRYPRFYYPEPCSSATVAAAGMFAHAALVMQNIPQLKDYAGNLRERALRAWSHFQQHPRSPDCDDGSIKSGDSDRTLVEQEQASIVAAVYLFALTGDDSYSDAVSDGFRITRPMQEDRWSSYDPEQGEALIFYTTLAKADGITKSGILERKLAQARSVDIYAAAPEADLYRAYMRGDSFHWGHNMVRANVGNTNFDLVQYGLVKPGEAPAFVERAAGLLHSFHGVNPLGIVYLTNMYAQGATRSVNQIFHTWYRDGDPTYDDARSSRLGPPPGYVPGGPNSQYCKGQDPSQNKCASSRLLKQPAQKAYLDFNTGWDPKQEHDRSWEITEPGVYYQASYVKLLSKFVQ